MTTDTEREWEKLAAQSRKNNTGMINMFGAEPPRQETFTERFRRQAAESREELQRMQSELQAIVTEVHEVQLRTAATFPIVGRRIRRTRPVAKRGSLRPLTQARAVYLALADGELRRLPLAWRYRHLRRHNGRYLVDSFGRLLEHTESFLDSIAGLTTVIDRLMEEGLSANSRLLYEEELKSLSHRVNDVYLHINRAGFQLSGLLAKEKDIAVNVSLDSEDPAAVLRHHRDILWGYRQFTEHQREANDALRAGMHALDLFTQAIRKEVMRRKVEQLHANVKDISLARMEALRRQKEEAAAMAELGEEYIPDELPELPAVPMSGRAPALSEEEVQARIEAMAARKAAAERAAEEAALRAEESAAAKQTKGAAVSAEEEDEDWDEAEGNRSIVPLIILVLILVGVGVYYFMKD